MFVPNWTGKVAWCAVHMQRQLWTSHHKMTTQLRQSTAWPQEMHTNSQNSLYEDNPLTCSIIIAQMNTSCPVIQTSHEHRKVCEVQKITDQMIQGWM